MKRKRSGDRKNALGRKSSRGSNSTSSRKSRSRERASWSEGILRHCMKKGGIQWWDPGRRGIMAAWRANRLLENPWISKYFIIFLLFSRFLRRGLDLNENDKLQANARKKSIMMKRIYEDQLTAQGINRNDVPLDDVPASVNDETFVFPVSLPVAMSIKILSLPMNPKRVPILMKLFQNIGNQC